MKLQNYNKMCNNLTYLKIKKCSMIQIYRYNNEKQKCLFIEEIDNYKTIIISKYIYMCVLLVVG